MEPLHSGLVVAYASALPGFPYGAINLNWPGIPFLRGFGSFCNGLGGHHAHTEYAEAFELRIMVVDGIGIDES